MCSIYGLTLAPNLTPLLLCGPDFPFFRRRVFLSVVKSVKSFYVCLDEMEEKFATSAKRFIRRHYAFNALVANVSTGVLLFGDIQDKIKTRLWKTFTNSGGIYLGVLKCIFA